MKKLSLRFVPRFPTVDPKLYRVTASRDGLQLLQLNPLDFRRRFFTVDKTLIQ